MHKARRGYDFTTHQIVQKYNWTEQKKHLDWMPSEGKRHGNDNNTRLTQHHILKCPFRKCLPIQIHGCHQRTLRRPRSGTGGRCWGVISTGIWK